MKDYQSQAFVYKWKHISTNMWYVGSRTAKNCHPNDGYICSSAFVKSMILNRINKIPNKVYARKCIIKESRIISHGCIVYKNLIVGGNNRNIAAITKITIIIISIKTWNNYWNVCVLAIY